MNNQFQRRSKVRRTAAVATIIVVVMAILLIDHLKNEGLASSSNPVVSTQPIASSSDPANTASSSAQTTTPGTYKDGVFSAQSEYRVPHSLETIKVTLTLKNGVVASTQVQNSEGDGTSAVFQEDFAAEYQSFVIGKSLSRLNLDVVAGASDTTAGFNQAVNSIRSQAQG